MYIFFNRIKSEKSENHGGIVGCASFEIFMLSAEITKCTAEICKFKNDRLYKQFRPS